MEQPRYLVGQFLLAMPGIGDPRFERSITAVCAHDDDGAMGIGIGRTLPGLTFHDLLTQLNIAPQDCVDKPVLYGGPVEPQRGFVLHSKDWAGQDSVSVGGLWTLSTTQDCLKAIASGKGPSRWLVAMGYAGWSAGQLDGEMTRHGWHLAAGNAALMFDTPINDRWADAFRSTGIDPVMLSATSGHA